MKKLILAITLLFAASAIMPVMSQTSAKESYPSKQTHSALYPIIFTIA